MLILRSVYKLQIIDFFLLAEDSQSKQMKKRKLKESKTREKVEGARGPRGGHVLKISKTNNTSLAKKLQEDEKGTFLHQQFYQFCALFILIVNCFFSPRVSRRKVSSVVCIF